MSQVVVTSDKYKKAREESLELERKIDTHGFTANWRISDATKTTFIERVLGVAFMGVLAFWSFLLICLGVSFAFCLGIFKVLSKLISR